MVHLAKFDGFSERYPSNGSPGSKQYGGMIRDFEESLPEFTEQDLIKYILSTSNPGKDMPSQTIGFYSGSLLNVLTERNKQQGKGTRIVIDGQGRTFNGLFRGARNVDELYLKNFKGENICAELGKDEGKVNVAVCQDIDGISVFSSAGRNKGNLGLLIAKNTGNYTYSDLCRGAGNADLIIGQNIGREGFDRVWGEDPVYDQEKKRISYVTGTMGMILIHDAKNPILRDFSFPAGLVAALEVEDENLHLIPPVGSRINRLLYRAGEKNKTLWERFKDTFLGVNQYFQLNDSQLDTSKEAVQKNIEEYRLNEFVELVSSIENAQGEEVFEITHKIKKIYQELKPKLEIKKINYVISPRLPLGQFGS